MLKVKEHSELLSAQYLNRCLEPENVCHSITTIDRPKRHMKETLFTRHRNTVEPMMFTADRKATFQAINTDSQQRCQERNAVLADCHHPTNNSERKERATIAQLRSRYCGLLVLLCMLLQHCVSTVIIVYIIIIIIIFI